MKVNIGGIVDVSTIDFTQKLCSVIFFCDCPFRCPFCQNWKLLINKNCKSVDVKNIISSIKDNFIIDGVTVTGGEPTLQIKPLMELLSGVRSLGLATKIDTNGFFPNNIKKLLIHGLLDYVALDIKSSLQPEIYGSVVGVPDAGHEIVKRVRESLRFLIESHIPFEVRTTIVPGLIDKEKDVERIAKDIQGSTLYVLQQFRSDEGTLDPKFRGVSHPKRKQLLKLAKVAKNYLSDIRIRTTERGEEKI